MTGHPDPDAPVRLAAALRAAARARDQRRLVVLAGPRRWSGETAVAMLDDAPRAWIGARAVDGGACVPAAKARGLLGGEWAQAVFDAHDGLDVEALAAVAGTLRGGGLLLLLTPPLDAWPSRPDPALARLLSSPATPADAAPRFVTRLVRQIRADRAIAVCTPGAVAPAPAPPIGGAPPERRAGPDGCLGEDQRRAVRAVVEAVDGTPAVLTADRGRGKSAALGLGAARLLAGRPCRIVVTAPRRSAADAVFRHAARRLGLAPARGDLRLGAGRELRFVAPDRLLREPPAADLVLVDEAAAIPAPLLEALLRRDPRIVYATTVHGYEGTGRGFALRFRASLDRLAPGWREVELEVPVRWAAEDPLEAWLNRSLLLDAAPASPAASGNAPRCRRLDRDALLDDEPRLRHLFGLLVQAHYRTTPSDLRQLLDAPGVGLHVAEVDDVPVGVAVTVAEGRIDAATSLAVWAGLRRLRGHLVAQSLAGHAGLEAAPRLAIRRVQRIAVDPGWRRRGVGRALLASLARESREAGDDLVATSFGMTPGLLAFWTACGFRPARVGLRREASSGAHALMMLHPLSDDGEALADEAARRLGGALPILLRDVLADLESELADPLRACLPPPPTGCTEADWLEAVAFAFGARGPDACAASLQRVVGTLRLRSALPGPPQGAALTARFLDHAPWARVASQLGCRGRGQAIRQLRAALRPALRARHATGLAERIARLEGLRHDPARGSSGDDPSRD